MESQDTHVATTDAAPASAPLSTELPEGVMVNFYAYLTNEELEIRLAIRNSKRVPLDFTKMVADALLSAQAFATGPWRMMTDGEIKVYCAEHGDL